jgi:hypothetical protein
MNLRLPARVGCRDTHDGFIVTVCFGSATCPSCSDLRAARTAMSTEPWVIDTRRMQFETCLPLLDGAGLGPTRPGSSTQSRGSAQPRFRRHLGRLRRLSEETWRATEVTCERAGPLAGCFDNPTLSPARPLFMTFHRETTRRLSGTSAREARPRLRSARRRRAVARSRCARRAWARRIVERLRGKWPQRAAPRAAVRDRAHLDAPPR